MVIYLDWRGREYAVRPNITGEVFKAHYRHPWEKSIPGAWHPVRNMTWRQRWQDAVADLCEVAARMHWRPEWCEGIPDGGEETTDGGFS